MLRIEERLPARREVIEQSALVRQQLVVALVETVLLRQGKIAAEQIGDGRLIVSVTPSTT